MGLFDRLFGRKEEAKPQAQDHTEELVESPEEASSLVEPETSKASQSDEAKISAMEAYYVEWLPNQRDQLKSRKHLVKKHLQKSLSNRIQLSRKRPLLK